MSWGTLTNCKAKIFMLPLTCLQSLKTATTVTPLSQSSRSESPSWNPTGPIWSQNCIVWELFSMMRTKIGGGGHDIKSCNRDMQPRCSNLKQFGPPSQCLHLFLKKLAWILWGSGERSPHFSFSSEYIFTSARFPLLSHPFRSPCMCTWCYLGLKIPRLMCLIELAH